MPTNKNQTTATFAKRNEGSDYDSSTRQSEQNEVKCPGTRNKEY